MTAGAPRGRAGSFPGTRLALLLLLSLCLGGTRALAQVPPDTVTRPDTVRVAIPPEEVAADTLPRDSLTRAARDSLAVAATLPPLARPFPTGFAFGRWELGRDDLLRLRGLSLFGLLERLPGFTGVTAGGYGRPAGVTALGMGGARLRIFRDGVELDPLGRGSYDLHQIGLIDLDAVRVERTPGEIRVELTGFRLPDARPYSEIEIGAGNYGAKLLRAMLARTVGSRSVLSGSYDLVTTEGYGIDEPFQFGGGRVGWSYAVRPGTALQLDFSTSAVEREGSIDPLDVDRRDLVLRGRSRLGAGLVLDLAAGRSWWRPEGDSLRTGGAAAVDTVRPELAANQLFARASYELSRGAAEAGVRLRQGGERGVPTPDAEIFGRALLRPLPGLLVEGEASAQEVDGERFSGASLGAAVGSFLGFTAFASLGSGERWFGTARDTTVTLADTAATGEITTRRVTSSHFGAGAADVSGARAGVRWAGRGIEAGAAFVTLDPTTVAPFGLGFDRDARPAAVQAVEGIETHLSLSVPGTRGAVRLDGSYSRWSDQGFRPYLPREQGRGSVELHGVFYDGQLEPTLRVEGEYRGPTLVPGGEPGASGVLLNGAVANAYSLLNLYLQIRIVDVRAFLFWDNLLNQQEPLGLDRFLQPGPRLVYGGRWFFRN